MQVLRRIAADEVCASCLPTPHAVYRLVKTDAAAAEAVSLHEGLLDVTRRHHGNEGERTAAALQTMAKVGPCAFRLLRVAVRAPRAAAAPAPVGGKTLPARQLSSEGTTQ